MVPPLSEVDLTVPLGKREQFMEAEWYIRSHALKVLINGKNKYKYKMAIRYLAQLE